MAITKGPARGVATELKITPEGTKRFFVGLGWNPYDAVGVKIERSKGPSKSMVSRIANALFAPFEFFRVGTLTAANKAVEAAAKAKYTKTTSDSDRKSSAYDLDLLCYVFDRNMKLTCTIGTSAGETLQDPSKKVSHSGDNRAGSGGQDDEVISVETEGLPENCHHFYFVVKCDSKYSFDQYKNPNARIADGKDGLSQAECYLGAAKTDKDDKRSVGMFNYIFCHAYRDGGGWKFETVDQFVPEGADWANSMAKLASAA